MKRVLAALAMMSALAGCAEGYYAGGPPPAPPSPAPPAHRPPVDTCGAASLQYLVGRPISELPGGYAREYRRVIGQHAIVDQQYIGERLTVVYDEDTGRITRVRCG